MQFLPTMQALPIKLVFWCKLIGYLYNHAPIHKKTLIKLLKITENATQTTLNTSYNNEKHNAKDIYDIFSFCFFLIKLCCILVQINLRQVKMYKLSDMPLVHKHHKEKYLRK